MTRTAAFGVLTLSMVAAMSSCSSGDPELAGSGGSGFGAQGGEAGVAGGDIHLSMERNMQCGIGLCGHCQLGPVFVCKDGPVFTWDQMRPLMAIKEL